MRVVETPTYLKTVPFAEILFWDTKRYTSLAVESSYPIVSLGTVITEQKKRYKLEEAETEYGILGVNNKEGIFDAYLEKGKKINQAYKKMEAGWIAYNPYRINVGSIGIRLENHTHEYISPAYVVFSCKEQLLPEYLFLLFKTDTFNRIIKENTTGSVRQNLKFDTLSQIKIPLPSITEQQQIVDAYKEKLNKAQQLELEANKLDDEIDKAILTELKIENVNQVANEKFRSVSFSKIKRWDVWVASKLGSSSAYDSVTLGDVVIGKPTYGANVKGVKKTSDTRYIRITDINEDGGLNDDFVSPEKVEEKYLLQENDFLIARSGNTVGKTFLYKPEHGRAIYAGYLVKYNLNEEKIIPEYLLLYTKSSLFKKWIASNQRVSGQPNINGQEYLSSPVILPPLNIQKEIINKVVEMRKNIKSNQLYAIKNREAAIKEFEQKIFN